MQLDEYRACDLYGAAARNSIPCKEDWQVLRMDLFTDLGDLNKFKKHLSELKDPNSLFYFRESLSSNISLLSNLTFHAIGTTRLGHERRYGRGHGPVAGLTPDQHFSAYEKIPCLLHYLDQKAELYQSRNIQNYIKFVKNYSDLFSKAVQHAQIYATGHDDDVLKNKAWYVMATFALHHPALLPTYVIPEGIISVKLLAHIIQINPHSIHLAQCLKRFQTKMGNENFKNLIKEAIEQAPELFIQTPLLSALEEVLPVQEILSEQDYLSVILNLVKIQEAVRVPAAPTMQAPLRIPAPTAL
jgi:hypothetical protein